MHGAGFGYMWTKAGFGRPGVIFREDDFFGRAVTHGGQLGRVVAVYNLGSGKDVKNAERRLLRSGQPGWFAGTDRRAAVGAIRGDPRAWKSVVGDRADGGRRRGIGAADQTSRRG